MAGTGQHADFSDRFDDLAALQLGDDLSQRYGRHPCLGLGNLLAGLEHRGTPVRAKQQLFDIINELFDLLEVLLMGSGFDQRFIGLAYFLDLFRRDNHRIGDPERLHVFGQRFRHAVHLVLDLGHQQART